MLRTITIHYDDDAPTFCGLYIRRYLTTQGGSNVHQLRRYCMEHVANCRVEDFNAALVDLIADGVVRADGMSYGTVLFVM